MIALHGIWSTPVFYLWGEGLSIDSPEMDSCEKKSKSKNNHPVSHPFAMTCRELEAATGEISPDGLLASVAVESKLTLNLPCAKGRPLSSHPPEKNADPNEIRLSRISVPALALAPADAIDFLTGPPEGAFYHVDDSLRYWRILAKYVLSLLHRRQFVPAIEDPRDTDFTGRWRAFISDPQEMTWLERFVQAMPPVCHSLVTNGETDQLPPHLVDGFLAESCEAVIRRSLANDPFFEQIHRRANKEGKWELRWLSALMGQRRRVRWNVENSAEIVGLNRSWIGQLEHSQAEKTAELCFTLLEPEDGSDPGRPVQQPFDWFVRFDLRSSQTGDYLDLARIWHEPGQAPSILGKHLINRREHLRSELIRAAEVIPEIKTVLDSPTPAGLPLDTEGADRFIREQAPLLRAQGFAVHLPTWTTDGARQLGLELYLQPDDASQMKDHVSLESFGLNRLMDFNWRVALGDQQLSIEEFEALAAKDMPLVNVRGQWVTVEQGAATKALRFIKKRWAEKITLAEALRMAAGLDEREVGLPVLRLSGTDWVKRLLDKSPGVSIETMQQPHGFNGTLRPYQLRGLGWLVFLNQLGLGACLADDMGLGKTIQLIAMLLQERRVAADEAARAGPASISKKQSASPGPTLLFVPMSVVGNWQREIHRFAKSLRVLVHHGQDRLAGDAFIKAANKHDIIITTYGLANRDLSVFRQVPWHRIALDEAQKIKNPSANQTLAIRTLQAHHRVALTGTPLENHLSELWSIMEMLNPGLLGSAASFRKRFVLPIEKMGDHERAKLLRRMIQPFMLRRIKTDPNVECDLPEKMEMKVYCNLTTEQAALYQRTVQGMISEVDQASGIRRRGLILATLTQLKQICNHPAHFLQDGSSLDGRSGKCERLAEMLEVILEEGDAALIFTQYKVMGDLLTQFLADRLQIKVPFLHGSCTMKQREKMIEHFQNPDSDVPVFLLSLKAGGFGLNLTRANHVFHFDRWWNPAVEQQATDRAHRIGQTRRVQVHKFVSIGTIEDRIDQLLTEKAALADQIVSSGEGWLTELSTGDLRSYLDLSIDNAAEPS